MTDHDMSTVDFDAMAATFDRVAPLLEPVTDALVDALPPLEGATVLDVACGTGEPGLSLALRRPVARVIGLDPAETMVAVARAKAARLDRTTVEFVVAPAEELPVPDGVAQAVVSRFGLLAFGDPVASAREVARVLVPGGVLGFAVWAEHAVNPLAHTTLTALGPDLPAGMAGLLAEADLEVEHRRRVDVLERARIRDVESRTLRWHYGFDDFDSLWALVSGSAMLAPVLATVGEQAARAAHERLRAMLTEHRRPDGSYLVPQSCLLYRGAKP